MTIPIQCPACEHDFSVPDKYAGRRGKCPKCGNVFRAPAAPIREATPLPATPVAASSVPRPKRLEDLDPLDDLGDFESSAPAAPVVKKSPPVKSAAPLETDSPLGSSQSPLFTTSPAGKSSLAAATLHSAGKRKKKAASGPLIAALAGGGAAILLIGGLAVMYAMSPPKKNVAQKPTAPVVPDDSEGTKPTTPEKPKDPPPAPAVGMLDLAPLQKKFESSVCRLLISAEGEEIEALGFVVGSEGLVVTSFHPLKMATSATVQFGASDPLPVAGTLAIDRASDLALLQVELTENDGEGGLLKALDVASSLPPIDHPLAGKLGTQSELFSCVVRRTLPAGQLPGSVLAIVREREMADDGSVRFIQFDERPLPAQTGGPLLNSSGEVAGVVTALDRLGKTGYAIASQHVLDLLAKKGSRPEPLAPPPEVAVGDPLDVPKFPVPEPQPEPEAEPQREEFSVAHVNYVVKKCSEWNWVPADAAQYERFQDLAFLATVVHNPGVPADVRQQVQPAVEAALNQLNEVPWPEANQRAKVNEMAAAVTRSGNLDPAHAFYGYGAVLFSSSDGGLSAVIFELLGSGKKVMVPIKEEAAKFTPASRWLIMGQVTGVARLSINGVEEEGQLLQSIYLLSEPVAVDE